MGKLLHLCQEAGHGGSQKQLDTEVEVDEVVAMLPQHLTAAFTLPEKKIVLLSALSDLVKEMYLQASRPVNLMRRTFGKMEGTPKEGSGLLQERGETAAGVVDAEFTEPEFLSGGAKSEGLDLERFSGS